jgi:hypothetical protein
MSEQQPQTTQTPPALRTDISVDMKNRTILLEFSQDENNHVAFTFTKQDVHKLIDGLQAAVNAIGNRKAKVK